MTLEFLSPNPDGAVLAESPLEPWLRAAGARFEARDGWRSAVDFGAADAETTALSDEVGIADRSTTGKLELQGPAAEVAEALESLRGQPVLLWNSSPDRVLAICEPAETARIRASLADAVADSRHIGLVELTAGLAAFELRGPDARALLERLTTIDVRPSALVAGDVHAAAVAEVPAALFCLEEDAFLLLVAAPEAGDAWEVVIDAGAPFRLRPVGERARAEAVARSEQGEPARA